MLGTGVKRIIFSIYRADVDKHTSAPPYKRNQFRKFKKQIIANHKAYAKLCGADYELFTDVESNYDIIQFQKISMIKKLTQEYDEVLYIDFDVIINTRVSFFEHFDLNTICAYALEKKHSGFMLRYSTDSDTWNAMDMYSKACNKNAMLLLDNIYGSDLIINTGVLGLNKISANLIDFSECTNIFFEAKKDTIYPDVISKRWKPNNEVYLSYLIERYDLPFTNIGLQWNFILDNTHKKYSSAAYFHHCVNKDFNLVLSR
mgnify:FL=1